MEEYYFLSCGDICHDGENWSIFPSKSLQVSVSSAGLCWTEEREDTLTDWESTWRSQTKFCIFFIDIHQLRYLLINLSEILIILKYLSIFTRCDINQKIALVISFVGENSFYRYLNGHKSTSSLLFAYLFLFLHSFQAHY